MHVKREAESRAALRAEELSGKVDPSVGPGWTSIVLAIASIGTMVLFAYAGRLLVDDAFISFRYARHLVEGVGLVYNAGERVEGYTNFLWVILVAGGMELGLQPGTVATALGLAFYAGTLGLTWRMAQRLLGDARWSAAVIVLVGTQFSVLTFATGGLETSLQTCLLTAGCALVVGHGLSRSWRWRDFLALSLICAAGMLTRMDFVLFSAVLIPAAFVASRAAGPASAGGPARLSPVGKAAALVAPAALIVGAWLLWKWFYYGSVLPNTYYAKRPGAGAMASGLRYVWDFAATYLYLLPAAFVLIGSIELIRRRHVLLIAPCIMVLWLAYLVRIGGDFIEFRLFVPIMPLFMLTLVWTLHWLARAVPLIRLTFVPVIVIAWTIVGSIHHMNRYKWDPHKPEPISQLAFQTQGARWIESGKALHRYFPEGHVVIATSAAGAMPYYAQLPTIDILGLNDREVAHHGEVVSGRPGHQRIATLAYLRERKVNLMIGHPWPIPARFIGDFLRKDLASFVKARRIPEGGVIVFIPIGEGLVLPAWYMTPCDAVDKAIEQGGWQTFVVGARAS